MIFPSLCTGLHLIRQGIIELYKISPHGRELVIKILNEGGTFNEVPVFDHQTNLVNVSAVEDCETWIIESGVNKHCITQNPELSFYQVTNRLARLAQEALATRLGTVREVVPRSLPELERSRAIQLNRGLI